MRNRHSLLFGLAVLLLIVVIGLPFLLKGFKSGAGQGNVYVHVQNDQIMSPRQSVILRFSSPMVPAGEINAVVTAENAPLTLNPPVPGEGMWQDDQTFVFTPHQPYTPATRYIIALRPGVTDLAGEEVIQKLNFVSMPLAIAGIQQTNWQGDKLEVTVSLNLPVDPAALHDAMTITAVDDSGAENSVDYTVTSKEASNYLLVNIDNPAPVKYVFTITPELVSTLGPEPLGREYSAGLMPQKDVTVVEAGAESKVSETSNTVTVSSAYQNVAEGGLCTIYIQTTSPLDPEAVRPFLKVTPDKVENVVWNDGSSSLEITGKWASGDNVVVLLKAGAPAENGTKLAKDYQSVQVIPETEPFLRVDTDAQRLVITPEYGLRVPVTGVNVKTVEFSLWRLYDNNIPVEMANEYWDPVQFSERFSKFSGRMEVDMLEPRNQVFHKAIDLADLVKGKRLRGLYLLRINAVPMAAKDADAYWYAQSSEQIILITDLAPVVLKRDTGLQVWVNSLSGGTAVPGANVTAYSLSNQVVAQGRTNNDGLAALKPDQPGPWDMEPALIMVSTKDDVSFVNLAGSLFDNAEFDIWGESFSDLPYRAFCFTSRGVYRPGEHVDFKALFRDAQLLPPAPGPILYRVISPTGREMLRGNGVLSREGGLTGGFNLPEASPTGSYSLLVFAPGGEDQVFGSVTFNVEEFVPPRIEVSLKGSAEKIIGTEELKLDLKSDYLFGAPGANLKYSLDRTSLVTTFSHENWPGFYFGDDAKFESSRDTPLTEAALDGSGLGAYAYKAAKSDQAAPSMVQWLFVLNVQEDGGRWVSKSLRVPYYPRKEQLGLKLPAGYVEPGKATTFTVAAVDTEGKPLAELKAVDYTIERVIGHYNYVRQPNGSYRYDYSEELVNVSKGEAALTGGSGDFAFTPNRTGTYRIRATGPNGAAAAARVHVWSPYWHEPGAGEDEGSRLTVADITFDKTEYHVGDTAQVTVRAPFKGRLLFNVESGRTLLTRTLDMDSEEATLSITVTEDFIPNVYCTAWVIRPVKNEGKWSSHRAFGAAPLSVSQRDNLLAISLLSPDKALPNTELPVTVKLAKPGGAPSSGEVCLYLVDEAILTLTNYKTPDPMSLFWAKRALGLTAKDFYDELTPPESKATPLLKAGGGAAEAGTDYLSAIKRNQIMLTVFLGKIDVPDSGQAEVKLTLPEFSGKGRLMAVAASGKCLGFAEKFVTVARDLVVETTGPRAVAPGDEFVVPVKAFLSGGAAKNLKGEVKITVSGPLQRLDKDNLSLNMSPAKDGAGQAGPAKEFRIKAGPDVGLGVITVEAAIPGDADNSYSQTVEIPVRSPFPKTTLSGSGMATGNREAKLEIPDIWVPGTGAMTITAGKAPSMNLLPALNYLNEYPYGCLEQIVSRAWPFVVLPEMLKDVNPEFVNQAAIDEGLAVAVKRVAFMQLYDGSFALWPGDSWTALWASVYATHFLWEAQNKTPLPEGLLNSALSFLKQIMAIPAGAITPYKFDSILSTKAYAAYVLTLAGQAPLAWLQQLHEDRDLLSPSGRVYLAAAMALHEKSSRPLRALGQIKEMDWTGLNPTLESTPRNQAILLTAWSQVDPAATEAGLLAKGLQESAAKGMWHTTQENAMALVGLSKYYAANPDRNKPFTAMVKGPNGESLLEFSSEKDGKFELRSLRNLFNKGLPVPATLTVDGQGSAYYSWSSTGVPKEAPAPFAENLKVSLTLKDDAGKVLVWDGAEPLRIKQGTRLNATLKIEPSMPVEQLIAVSVLPGGLEVDNPRLQDLQDSRPQDTGESSGYYAWNCRLDLRDDRLILIADYLNAAMEYSFTMRAVSKGTFIMPPVAGEGMYAPFIRSLSKAGTIIVE